MILSLLLLTQTVPAYAAPAPAVQAEAVVVMSGDGGVLYAKNADTRRLIASTTKLMTALVCLENTSIDDVCTAQERHCRVEGSSMYLKAGERYTVRELLLGLLLSSGNDAALALAEYTAGSEGAFVQMMNRKAQELGLRDTHFENPHGLDAKSHYSTARDLARLMLACMENGAFRGLAVQRSAEVKGLTLLNHNRLLTLCPGCVGGKTGYTRAAGRCLVSCCERDGLRLACVTLSDPDDWNDHRALYDWAYANFTLRDLHAEFSFDVPVISGSRTSVRVVPAPGCAAVLPRDRETVIRAELPRFVFAPVNMGEEAGTFTIFRDGDAAVTFPLIYAGDAALADPCIRIFNREESSS